jgi:hypothetical protein
MSTATQTRPTDAGAGVGSDHRWAGAPTSRTDGVVAALVAVGVMVLGVVFRTGLVPTDPWRYMQSARDFPSDDWVPLGYTRYGIILANALPLKLFGEAQAAFYFWPIISSGALAAAIYLIGRRWWGPLAGAIAVGLFLANTVVLLNLSRGYPDIMSMAITMWALFLALLARDRLAAGRRAVLLLLAVGALLGWGFEVRETSMFLWPVVLVVLWHRAFPWRTLLIVLVPLLGWAALDVGISAWAYGDPLLKLHTLTGNVVQVSTDPDGEVAADNIVGLPRSFYFLVTPRAMLGLVDGAWMIGLALVALVGLVVRNWPLRLLSASLVLVYLLNVLPAGGLDPSKPRGKLDVARYWIQYFPSVALVIGGLTALAVAWAVRRYSLSDAGRRGLAVAAALGVLAYPVSTGISYLATFPAFPPSGGAALEDLRDHLRGTGTPDQGVWSDWHTKRILPAYQRDPLGGSRVWLGTPKSLTGDGTPEEGDLVLLYSVGSETCGWCERALRPWLDENPEVPSSWRLVHESESDNLRLYRVGG